MEAMKFLVIAAAFVFAVETRYLSDQEEWEQFKIQHGKTYRSLLEERERFSIFQSNLRAIEEHNEKYNRGEESFSMKINHFGDMTQEEFQDTLVRQMPRREKNYVTFEDGDVPETFDWRKLGAVTKVKEQKECGSCWAFSSAGAIEGQVFIHKKTLASLSPQQLVDCAGEEYHNHGCKGGRNDNAFEYVKDHGILTEKEYPYTATNGTCLKEGGLKISGFEDIPEHDEVALTKAIATKGPVSVAMDSSSLQFYEKGVVDGSRCNSTKHSLNHEVLLVGYEKDYYIAKNTWGADWGQEGYFNIQRDSNTCGISLDNSYPVL